MALFALDLSKQLCANLIPVDTGEVLGYGADGDVHVIKDNPNQVIKFAKLYESFCEDDPIDIQLNNIIGVLDYIQNFQIKCFAKVYSYNYLGTFDRHQVYEEGGKELVRRQRFALYYYIMERLHKISDDEKKVFHSIICHEDRGYDKNYSIKTIESMLNGMEPYFSFDKEKVLIFCININKAPIKHNDLHKRNIMKDDNGNYKLVDFDRATIKVRS
jgi:hypothetical protein